MHKFNLKGKVVDRMKGIEPENAGTCKEDGSGAAERNGQPGETPEVLRVAWRTDVGRIRKNNQDAVIIGNGLLGVADGMGGHNGGEIASAGLRDGLLRETEKAEPGADTLKDAVRKVNHELWEQQEKDAALTGMGTTLTILWPAGDEMVVGQVGDSRAYLIRGEQMKQVTDDHSMVADMVRRGVLTEEQAACHPMRNYITRAVGTDDSVEVDVTTVRRAHGDRWLVCSDGLHGQMDKAELEKLARIKDLEEAADSLLQTALDNGGKDNISLVLIQDDGEYPPEPEEEKPQAETADPEPDGEGEAEA